MTTINIVLKIKVPSIDAVTKNENSLVQSIGRGVMLSFLGSGIDTIVEEIVINGETYEHGTMQPLTDS